MASVEFFQEALDNAIRRLDKPRGHIVPIREFTLFNLVDEDSSLENIMYYLLQDFSVANDFQQQHYSNTWSIVDSMSMYVIRENLQHITVEEKFRDIILSNINIYIYKNKEPHRAFLSMLDGELDHFKELLKENRASRNYNPTFNLIAWSYLIKPKIDSNHFIETYIEEMDENYMESLQYEYNHKNLSYCITLEKSLQYLLDLITIMN